MTAIRAEEECGGTERGRDVASMKVLHWCLLGVTILLLVCEVTISQLCNSLIVLVDGFHALFILMRMVITPLQTASTIKPPLSSLDSPASPPHASSSSAASPANLPDTQTATNGSTIPDRPPTPTKISPAAFVCGLSYTSCRIQVVGGFVSALLLASLCLSYIMEIVGFILEPQPVQRPLLLVMVSTVSLLHKMIVLWLMWDQLQAPESKSHLEVNQKVPLFDSTKGQAEPRRALCDVSQVQSAVDDLLHSGTLVLCNPGTSSIPDTDSQTPEPQVEVHTAAPQDNRDCEVVSGAADLSHSKDITELSKDNTCMEHLGSQNASKTSSVYKSSHHTERPLPTSQWPVRLPLFILIIQGLCSSLLALINSLVMLLIAPQHLHSSGACRLLVYLDPILSLLAVITLTATTTPQVHRYGLLLLQATPPHVCVSDLGRRIASVPGVQAVHDLHIWQLNESFTVASVHVHCHVDFPAHRCPDLMLGITNVLQSVGVNCCTVQPEFPSCPGSCGGCGDASAVVHREDPSLPALLACSLACGKACAGSLCCSPLEEESRTLLAPPAGETKEEPQSLVIENTFL
uniref:zinc homeostasis factor 1 n=1 Tax=Scatophagus argus TaxID=75038 RepID=UPI001ED7D06D|nr:zinc homeostasis factor 1 [Scatophagus argus]